MPGSRSIVSATTSQLTRIVQFEELTGTPNGMGGLTNGGNWSVVAGLGNVPFVFKSWTPWQKWVAQQQYPGVTTRGYMRYRKSVNVTPAMRMKYGAHVYKILAVMNYDEGNRDVVMYLEELQAKGSGH